MSDEAKNRVQRNKRLIFDAEAYVQFNTAQSKPRAVALKKISPK